MASTFALDQSWAEQDLATHFATIPLKLRTSGPPHACYSGLA